MKTQDPQPSTPLESSQTEETKESEKQQNLLAKSSKRFTPIRLIGVIVLLLLVGGVGLRAFSLLTKNPEEQETTAQPNKLPVKVVAVKSEPIQAWVFGDGFVDAITKKHLTFQTEGTINFIKQIDGRDLREGDRVRKGELLARVDQRKSNAEVTVAVTAQTEAKNQVLTAIANRRKAEESLAQAQTDLQKAKTDVNFAQADLKRYQGLAEDGVIQKREVDVRQTEYDNALAAVTAAEAGIRAAKAELESAKTQVETAEAGVNSANAQLTQSLVNREDTEIVAPFNGLVSRLNIRKGDYWTPQIVNASAEYETIVERLPIIIIDPNQFEINIDLPAFQGNQVQPGQRVLILPDVIEENGTSKLDNKDLLELAQDKGAQGTVFSVSPSISPGERSVHITIRVSEGNEKLSDGERVAAWVAVEEKNNATVAPFNAFVYRDQKPHVFVVNKENIVQQREIKEGIQGLTRQEIIEGVQPGDLLVTEGLNRLVDGAAVEIVD